MYPVIPLKALEPVLRLQRFHSKQTPSCHELRETESVRSGPAPPVEKLPERKLGKMREAKEARGTTEAKEAKEAKELREA